MGIGRRSEKDGFKSRNGVKLIREGAREMGMQEAHNRFVGTFRESKLHFTIWYMVFVGNFRSGFC
jgi:hypothetical protein